MRRGTAIAFIEAVTATFARHGRHDTSDKLFLLVIPLQEFT